MEIRIFQINLERDADHLAFADMKSLERYRGSREVDSGIYDEVFSGEVDCGSLEDVYRLFNTDRPAGFAGRSLSVSDVVQVISDSETAPGFYFCDTIGFSEISFDPEQAVGERPGRSMRVVMLEPDREARIAHIGSSLEDMQAAVGGYIEAVYPFREQAALICNDEGKLLGLPLNRALRHEDTREIYDVIAGPCFICGCSGDNFGSLSPELADRFARQFWSPEQFFRINGTIIAVPFDPEPEGPIQEALSR